MAIPGAARPGTAVWQFGDVMAGDGPAARLWSPRQSTELVTRGVSGVFYLARNVFALRTNPALGRPACRVKKKI